MAPLRPPESKFFFPFFFSFLYVMLSQGSRVPDAFSICLSAQARPLLPKRLLSFSMDDGFLGASNYICIRPVSLGGFPAFSGCSRNGDPTQVTCLRRNGQASLPFCTASLQDYQSAYGSRGFQWTPSLGSGCVYLLLPPRSDFLPQIDYFRTIRIAVRLSSTAHEWSSTLLRNEQPSFLRSTAGW